MLFLKYGRKIPLKSRKILKVSLHFKKMANSSLTVLQKYSEICIFLCDTMYRLPEAVSGRCSLKFLENIWKLSRMKFILWLICLVSPTPSPPGKLFFPQVSHFSPYPSPKTPPSRHINNSLSVYLFLDSELL